ncbi:DUF4865 family protein [Streptomyces sp. NPDC058439]|uniref:DUF4865 family protein n=1 Tax=Streptomyces sp. NPDC058439 TaxID=3346500 RepID=UPI0036500F3C
MLSAHYDITLPADYDMGIIRQRVTGRSAPWDLRAGLLLKAFCVTSPEDTPAGDGAGPSHKSYAPFYVWDDPGQFAAFLTGPEYAGLRSAFGPVPVATATVLESSIGSGPASHLIRTREHLGPFADLRSVARAEEERRHAALDDPAVHSYVADLDAVSMIVTRRTLLREGNPPPKQENGAQVLRVLHLSQPPRNTTD